MQFFREFTGKHAFAISLLLVAGYFLSFVYPALHNSHAFGHGTGAKDVESMNKMLPNEVALVASILLLIAVLGWRRQAGFRKHNPGTLKFAIAPAVFTALLVIIAVVIAELNGTTLLKLVGVSHLMILLLMTLLVGLYEESLFRGVLFHGAATKFSPMVVVLVTAMIFGLMHIVNYVNGQPLNMTIIQMINAAVLGFTYGMLRLIIGAIWPVILLHGFWDAMVSIMGTMATGLSEAGSAAQTSGSNNMAAFIMMMPALIYGLILVWVWRKRQNGDNPIDLHAN